MLGRFPSPFATGSSHRAAAPRCGCIRGAGLRPRPKSALPGAFSEGTESHWRRLHGSRRSRRTGRASTSTTRLSATSVGTCTTGGASTARSAAKSTSSKAGSRSFRAVRIPLPLPLALCRRRSPAWCPRWPPAQRAEPHTAWEKHGSAFVAPSVSPSQAPSPSSLHTRRPSSRQQPGSSCSVCCAPLADCLGDLHRQAPPCRGRRCVRGGALGWLLPSHVRPPPSPLGCAAAQATRRTGSPATRTGSCTASGHPRPSRRSSSATSTTGTPRRTG